MNTIRLFTPPVDGTNNMTGSVLSGTYTPQASASCATMVQLTRDDLGCFHFTTTGTASGSIVIRGGAVSGSLVRFPGSNLVNVSGTDSYVVAVQTAVPFLDCVYTHITGSGKLTGIFTIKSEN